MGVRTLSRCLIPAVLFSAAALARAAIAQEAGIKAFIVVDDKTGHILSEKDATKKFQVASLTKIATAIVAFDWARLPGHGLDPLVTITAADLAAGARPPPPAPPAPAPPPPPPGGGPGGVNPIGFQAGDQASLRDLLYAALLQSDNVAAEAIAGHVGRQLRAGAAEDGARLSGTTLFVAQMNALARSLGMERTRFLNPTGADGEEKPFSTAADMARLMRYALGKASFKFFIAQKERKIAVVRAGSSQAPAGGVSTSAPPPPSPPTAMGPAAAVTSGAASPAASATPPNSTGYLLRNTNELLGVKNVDGGKTGQTSRAGPCLIVTAAREPLVKQINDTSSEVTQRRLIIVVLGSNDRFRETAALLDRGTALYDSWAAAGRPSNGAKDTL